MSNDFDQFPVYDKLVKPGTNLMEDVWVDFIATFYQNLIEYLTQGGIMLPKLTTMQRDALISVNNGQMIYNTDLDTAQYFKNGLWTSF